MSVVHLEARAGGGVMFTVPGEPVPKSRARVTKRGTFTPTATREYENRVKAISLMARRAHVAVPLDATAWNVVVHLYRYRRTKADADNMVKAIMDGMNGTLYADDSQVEFGGWATYWVDTPEEAAAVVFATPLSRPPRPPRSAPK